MEAKVLVYQAYGQEDTVKQTVFSVISLLKVLEPDDTLQIWIYTDHKKLFTDFFGAHPRLHYFEISAAQIKKWQGPRHFVHRMKIEILKEAATQYKGCLFYCDGDTYFKSSPHRLFAKVNDRYSIMYQPENPLDQATDALSRKILKFVEKHQFQVGSERVGIGPSTVMWNAGVIGLSEKNKILLSLVSELADQSYSLYHKHVMEQLAFSFFLQTRSELLAADSVIYHYWDQKAAYQSAINQFLSENANVEKALEKYSSFPFPSAKVKKAKKTIIQKILHK